MRKADRKEVWQDHCCRYALITPASQLTYSVVYSILHLHKMLVFSCWGYNHNKLFANALGLHRVKKKKDVVEIEMKKIFNRQQNTKYILHPLTRFS